jgi:hypothetical protein
MRRYSFVRNAIERLREKWGLGGIADGQSVPTGEGPGPETSLHPLPTTEGQPPLPTMRPMPGVEGRPLFQEPPYATDTGSIEYSSRQRAQLNDIPKGGDAPPTIVYPNWESRLVNMRDFLVPLSFTFAETPTPVVVVTSAYRVPQGYIAFWKRFRCFFDALPAGLTPSNTLWTLLVDGDPVADYFNLPMGPEMTDEQDTFVIAAEGRLLSVRLAITANVGVLPATVTAFALLYGNLKLRTGNGIAREVGEPPPARPTPPTPPPSMAPPPPPPTAPPPAAAAPGAFHNRQSSSPQTPGGRTMR